MKQCLTLRPVTGLFSGWLRCNHLGDPLCPPGFGQGLRPCWVKCVALYGCTRLDLVVLMFRPDHPGRERKALAHDRRPTGQALAHSGSLYIERRHQQSRPNAVREPGVRRPSRQLDTPQVVCHKHDMRGVQHGLFEPDQPVSPQGALPIMLLDTAPARH